jgi:hypothetical protein
VADGDTVARRDPAGLPVGWAVTSGGRLSIASDPSERPDRYPFSTMDLVSIDNALTYGSRRSGSRFAVYIGDLGEDTAARARELLAEVPTPNNAVLLAVSPDQRAIEVVYGADLRGRGIDSAAPLGVSTAASAFREGDLIDGLVSAIGVMSAEIARR